MEESLTTDKGHRAPTYTIEIGNGLKMSCYKNRAGELVTLYTNLAGYYATVVCGEVTMYNKDGDMMCGATDDAAAQKLLREWGK